MNDPAAATRQPRRRRWLIPLGVSLLIVATMAALAGWWLQPRQATALLLRQLGNSLGLQLHADGPNEYRLRGTPQLVLRGLQVQRPGAAEPLLRAERVLVAVPWSTIRSRGRVLEIGRVELDKPQVQLAQLQAWLASRPTGDSRTPTFSDGIAIRGGQLSGDGWQLTALDLQLPELHSQKMVRPHLRGSFIAAPMRTDFDLAVAVTRPSLAAGVGIAGHIRHDQGSWRLPALLRASAPLRLHAGALALQPLRASVSGQWHSGDTLLPMAAALNARLRYADGRLQLGDAGLALRGDVTGSDPATQLVPDLDAHGALTLDKQLALRLRGQLHAWPAAWPTLPAPVGTSDLPLPFTLAYAGSTGLEDIASLQLRRDDTRFDARLRLPQVLAWFDAFQTGTPLPPLQGHLQSPRIDISGARLQGVDIRFDEPGLQESTRPRPPANAPAGAPGPSP